MDSEEKSVSEQSKFTHDITVRVEAGSREESLLRVEEIVQAIQESDALPSGVKVHSYTEGREME